MKSFLYLSLILFINQQEVLAFQPATENDYVLVGHVYKVIYTPDWFSCIQACHDDSRCTSYNYERSATANGLCELNDCGLQDLCDKDKSLIYWPGFVFQQIREGKKDEQNICISDTKRLKMSVPFDRPQYVQEINKTSKSILIRWAAVQNNERNGDILSYKIFYVQFRSENELNTKKVAAPVVHANLTGLHAHCRYNITVLASNVNGDGPSSEIVTIRTDEDKPRAPPTNVTVVNKTSTSILIKWDEVPNGKKTGRILKYKVEYRKTTSNNTSSKEVNALTRYLMMVNLKKNTNYTITVSAATVKGYGPASEPLAVVTDQDIPSAPPQNVQAANQSTNSILITWCEVPANQQNGKILSYNVAYTMIKRNTTENIQVEAPKFNLNLTGLQANTSYSITVMASTIKGHGPASPAIYVITDAGTCDVKSSYRFECGWYGIDYEACLTRGCCWDDSNSLAPYCFTKKGTSLPEGLCPVGPAKRQECGYFGIKMEECLHNTCCWDPFVQDTKWCYKQPADNTQLNCSFFDENSLAFVYGECKYVCDPTQRKMYGMKICKGSICCY